MKTVIIIQGIQRTGKSTFVKKLGFQDFQIEDFKTSKDFNKTTSIFFITQNDAWGISAFLKLAHKNNINALTFLVPSINENEIKIFYNRLGNFIKSKFL